MRNENTTKTNPFFTVKREKLRRKDRIDTGHDALYRADDGTQLAVVSRDYRLVKHRVAVDFVHHMLRDLGIQKKTIRSDLASNGGKLFYEVQLPEYKFNAAGDGVRNTALDGTAKKDEFVPRLIIRNSYDKSSSFSIIYGGFRFVCSNGVMIGDRVHEIRFLHRGEEIDLDAFREPFMENIVATVDGLKTAYRTLNQTDGHSYFELMLLDQAIAAKYKRMMIDRMASFEQVAYEQNDAGKLEPVGSRQRKDFTAYLLWSIVTGIATHHVRSAQARFRLQQLIGQRFAA